MRPCARKRPYAVSHAPRPPRKRAARCCSTCAVGPVPAASRVAVGPSRGGGRAVRPVSGRRDVSLVGRARLPPPTGNFFSGPSPPRSAGSGRRRLQPSCTWCRSHHQRCRPRWGRCSTGRSRCRFSGSSRRTGRTTRRRTECRCSRSSRGTAHTGAHMRCKEVSYDTTAQTAKWRKSQDAGVVRKARGQARWSASAQIMQALAHDSAAARLADRNVDA